TASINLWSTEDANWIASLGLEDIYGFCDSSLSGYVEDVGFTRDSSRFFVQFWTPDWSGVQLRKVPRVGVMGSIERFLSKLGKLWRKFRIASGAVSVRLMVGDDMDVEVIMLDKDDTRWRHWGPDLRQILAPNPDGSSCRFLACKEGAETL